MPTCRAAGPPLAATIPGRFQARPHRFGAWVETAAGRQYVHVATSGRMRELLVPGAEVLIRPPARPGKTAGTLVLVRHQGIWVSVDAQEPTRLVRRLLTGRQLPAFAAYANIKPEATFGASRIDFLLSGGTASHPAALLEVKSVTLVQEGCALFPDAPTLRGTRHLHELVRAIGLGWRAAVLFMVQRSDATAFTPHVAADPAFAAALHGAAAQGVEVYAYRCQAGPAGLAVAAALPVILG